MQDLILSLEIERGLWRVPEKLLSKCGLNLTASSTFDRTKQIGFSDYQITKKSNMKSKLRLNANDSSTITSTPHFANTMLAAVTLLET